MAELKIFSGNSNTALASAIANKLGRGLEKRLATSFKNGETRIEIVNSVRGSDVFIIQSGSAPVNDNLMELLLLIQAAKMDPAVRVTAVIPLMPYARQDKKMGRIREPISGKFVATMISAAGADRVITMDLHSPQVQGFFDIPVDNLSPEPAIIAWIKANIENWDEVVFVAPDAGGAKLVTSIAEKLNVTFALISKMRVPNNPNEVGSMVLNGNVSNKVTIIVDDMADTCGTICMAADKLKEAGATKVYAIVTHGIFSHGAIGKFDDRFEAVVVSNTVDQDDHMRLSDRIKLFDVSGIFAEAIKRGNLGKSISDLYFNVPN